MFPTPAWRRNGARRTLLALAVLGAVALAIVGAALPAAAQSLDGGDLEELEEDADLSAEVNASVDADGTTADGSVSAEGSATAGDTDASLSADADAGDGSVTVGAGLESGVALEPEVSVAAGVAAEDGDDGAGGASGGERDGSGDADGGADDGGLPAPDDLESGAAAGTLLLGGGLLGRRLLASGAASAGSSAASTAGSAASGGGSALSTALAWLRAWGWRLAALAGYQRWDGSDPLEHETRRAVVEHLEAEPGECLTELADAVDVPLSTLRYHLRILDFEDLVTSVEVRGKRRFFPADVDPDALAPALEDEATAAVLEALAREPDSVSGLADRLDRDPSTVSHHLQRLDEEGLVERERDGRSVVNRLADGVADEVAAAAARPVAGAAD